MKKSIVLFSILVLMLSSCSNNDDQNTPEEFVDPIIGNWQISAIVENDVGLVLFDCDLMQSVSFIADGNADSYTPFFDGTDCIDSFNRFQWQKMDTNLYEFDSDIPAIYVVEFSNNNNTIKFFEPDEETTFFIFDRI